MKLLRSNRFALAGFACLLPAFILFTASILKYQLNVDFLYNYISPLFDDPNSIGRRIAFIVIFIFDPLVAAALLFLLVAEINVHIDWWKLHASFNLGKKPVSMDGRVGISLNVQPENGDLDSVLRLKGSMVNLAVASISFCFLMFMVAHFIAD
ncbi:MAG TPA: hypothetical protein VFJ29_05270 [Candidatus Kapabacteria bacterium]|nr:hypothetical protein [Candidatus Kapabacteria bacterium]